MLFDTIFFDLDGTLLPLDMDEFMKIYFGELGKSFQDIISAGELVSHVWAGTEAMIANLEKPTNRYLWIPFPN